jgi:hypothetical protein
MVIRLILRVYSPNEKRISMTIGHKTITKVKRLKKLNKKMKVFVLLDLRR